MEYSDYSNVFSVENAAELPENTEMNEYAIKLEEDKQPPFRPIYSLASVELETLKTYIEINLANGFIRPSKSSAGIPILFDRKPDGSLHLLCKLLGSQQYHNQKPISAIPYRGIPQLTWPGKAIYLIGSNQCLSLDEDL